MIIFNITYSVNKSLQEKWYDWMISDFLPTWISEDKFIFVQICSVEIISDDCTYAIHHYCDSLVKLQSFMQDFENKIKLTHFNKFGDKINYFATILKQIKQLN